MGTGREVPQGFSPERSLRSSLLKCLGFSFLMFLSTGVNVTPCHGDEGGPRKLLPEASVPQSHFPTRLPALWVAALLGSVVWSHPPDTISASLDDSGHY